MSNMQARFGAFEDDAGNSWNQFCHIDLAKNPNETVHTSFIIF
jgi:hypothetical protein